jgi:hypothetical protein
MGNFLSPRIIDVSRKGVIECGAKNILRMRRQAVSHGGRQVGIGLVWHGSSLLAVRLTSVRSGSWHAVAGAIGSDNAVEPSRQLRP